MLRAHKKPIIYDTSLRDGLQARGVNLALEEKLRILNDLLALQIPYIELGWPGANPKDTELFARAKSLDTGASKIVAFGSTRRPKQNVLQDKQLQALLDAQTDTVTLVAKSHLLHVTEVLNTSPSENLKMISDSVRYLKDQGREVIIDAEHFFDGYIEDRSYAMDCLDAAVTAGVDVITLCDTNGGQMPETIRKVISELNNLNIKLGIHCHNDCELAVANSLAAWEAGVQVIQGTFNGVGERCGNANLTSLIPILQLKYQAPVIADEKLRELTAYAKHFSEYYNSPLSPFSPFVGTAAFAHKGGLHASAVAKVSDSYEHIAPETVGNTRQILVSEQSGRANIALGAKNLKLSNEQSQLLLKKVKWLDSQGVDFEEADASFMLFAKKLFNERDVPFELLGFNSHTLHEESPSSLHNLDQCQTTLKINLNGKEVLSTAEARGPVEAFDQAFREALLPHYPEINDMVLSNYKVRILDPQSAAAATTRVWIEAGYENESWCTVGCSSNILSASSQALKDSFEYFISEIITKRKSQNDHQAA